MQTEASIEARLLWQLIMAGTDGALQEPRADYSSLLESLEASELLSLIEMAQSRLQEITNRNLSAEPDKLFIDSKYNIRLGSPQGATLPLRPLVKALFLLFLKHPEGILLKQRAQYAEELDEIYSVISPNVDRDERHRRILRLVDIQDNSFSEKASTLNATLDKILTPPLSQSYKINGTNGHPRRIPLSPLLVEWQ